LTLLTVLPLVGAAIALVASKHARGVALITTLISLALALRCGRNCPRTEAIGLVERARSGRRRWALTTIWAWMG
jgi:hypothetical protein